MGVSLRHNLMGMHLPGVHLGGMYHMGLHLPGVYLMDVHHRGMYLMGVHLLGRVAFYRYVARRLAFLPGIHHRGFQIGMSNGRACEFIHKKMHLRKLEFDTFVP